MGECTTNLVRRELCTGTVSLCQATCVALMAVVAPNLGEKILDELKVAEIGRTGLMAPFPTEYEEQFDCLGSVERTAFPLPSGKRRPSTVIRMQLIAALQLTLSGP
jgi:hypothetical protein